jgi:S-adenosylmethionine hydrolase
LADTYAAVKQENFAALVNSWGLLEIAYKNGSAQLQTSAKIGDKVHIRIA